MRARMVDGAHRVEPTDGLVQLGDHLRVERVPEEHLFYKPKQWPKQVTFITIPSAICQSPFHTLYSH